VNPTVAIILLVVFILLVSFVVMYNRFVQQKNLVLESWHDVDVELQRRHDLIPNLVTTVKGYRDFESSVLQRVVEARTKAVDATGQGLSARGGAETQLDGALGQFLAVAENYPDLKASNNFLSLQKELATTEDRIAASRRFYNNNVRALNTRVATFPSNLVAGMFHFEKADFFQAEASTRVAPTASF
jgi:LemA protein